MSALPFFGGVPFLFIFANKYNQFSTWYNWPGDEHGLLLTMLSPAAFVAKLARQLVDMALISSVVNNFEIPA